jgi:hypothetical protein
MTHDPRAMPLTPLVAVSRPDLSAGQRWALAIAMTVLVVPLGVAPAVAAVSVLQTPVSGLWLTLIPTVGLSLLTTVACVMSWRGVVVLGARHARRYELLYGDRIVGHDGRSRDDHLLLLHDPRVHVATRYDHLARSRYAVTRPRDLTELVAPAADGRAGRLLLVDAPRRIVARDTDVPRQRRPDHELAAIAAVLQASPHPAGAQAASHVSALIGT